ncbi:MAG: carboxypeptidase regulatory-like domain-containing protein [Candidatus Marinimicrobia bacterium]|nr:carboxypeptidase regulatory-like domain-containing protein [Candidatus Neomarinimicrobiota bacterium]MCH7858540.1 carboxypeptidase regulatory-like domain-containing protein [Candidatus Neomarinimicrobiota bacterium]
MRNLIKLAMTLSVLLLASQILLAGGDIKGRINFKGSGPKPRAIKMAADPVCKVAHSEPVYSQSVVVNENATLRYVMVSIESGLEGQTFPVPEEPVVLDQNGCMYDPHVWGAMAGQTVEIRNSDGTLHNVHSLSKVNRQFNMAMPKIVKKKNKVFDKPEDIFAIKCDVHPWMRCWVGIFSHPFYSVSDDQGDFTLKDVPAGTYTVRAWHESKRLLAQTQTITVKEGETITLDFTFEAPTRK